MNDAETITIVLTSSTFMAMIGVIDSKKKRLSWLSMILSFVHIEIIF